MAEFDDAIAFTLRWEDPTLSGKITTDTGGKTRFGIAEKSNSMPDEFWNGPPENALNLAKVLYHEKYWHFDGIHDQGVATKIFDMNVNMGGNAIKIVQNCVHVAVDAVYGKATEQAINDHDPFYLLPDIRLAQLKFYRNLADANPTYLPYLNGWERRAVS